MFLKELDDSRYKCKQGEANTNYSTIPLIEHSNNTGLATPDTMQHN
jgi:hypothetical protein